MNSFINMKGFFQIISIEISFNHQKMLIYVHSSRFRYVIIIVRGGGTLVISGWGCAAGTLEPFPYTRATSAEFCYAMLE